MCVLSAVRDENGSAEGSSWSPTTALTVLFDVVVGRENRRPTLHEPQLTVNGMDSVTKKRVTIVDNSMEKARNESANSSRIVVSNCSWITTNATYLHRWIEHFSSGQRKHRPLSMRRQPFTIGLTARKGEYRTAFRIRSRKNPASCRRRRRRSTADPSGESR